MLAVRDYSGGRSLQRRVIALVAAYAIALSGLIASFSGAYAAANTTGGLAGALCHNSQTGQSSPLGDQSQGEACLDCCIGCLMPMAALPPPAANAVPAAVIVSHRVAPAVITALAGTHAVDIYQSRAPPV